MQDNPRGPLENADYFELVTHDEGEKVDKYMIGDSMYGVDKGVLEPCRFEHCTVSAVHASEDTTAGGKNRLGSINLLLYSVQRVRETLAVFFRVRSQSSEWAIVDACAKGGNEKWIPPITLVNHPRGV